MGLQHKNIKMGPCRYTNEHHRIEDLDRSSIVCCPYDHSLSTLTLFVDFHRLNGEYYLFDLCRTQSLSSRAHPLPSTLYGPKVALNMNIMLCFIRGNPVLYLSNWR
jgi:hypothetical protein